MSRNNDFALRLRSVVEAGVPIMHISTNEIVRTRLLIRETCIQNNISIVEWDINNGLQNIPPADMYNLNISGDNDRSFNSAITAPLKDIDTLRVASNTGTVYVYVNCQFWLENNPVALHYMQIYQYMLPNAHATIILLTPPSISTSIDSYTTAYRVPTPTVEELRKSLNTNLGELTKWIEAKPTEEQIVEICNNGLGMPLTSFESATALSAVEYINRNNSKFKYDTILSGVKAGKTEVIKKTDILELYPTESMSNVGGLSNLKKWIDKRKPCFSEEAKTFGITYPKGIMVVGIPGNGKSLIAKAIASALNVPLIRLDFGRIFNSLVGKSEERLRQALIMLQEVSPITVLIDEVEKGLHTGQGNDSGVSSRVFGTFLSFMQDNTKPIFMVFTANSIERLPAEFLRKGRLDAIFYVLNPDAEDRKEIFNIHLKKRGKKISDEEIQDCVISTEGFSGAEIESVVSEALIDAFNSGEELDVTHLMMSIKNTIPMSFSHKEKMDGVKAWCEKNAINASAKPTQVKRLRDRISK